MNMTLIITTYNWEEALELVLLSVQKQSHKPYEVIIADDGSREDTRELIEQLIPTMSIPTHHLWHEDNGFLRSVILNKAIAQAKGDYCIQVDGDVILHPDFLKDHHTFSKPGTYCPGSRTLLRQELSKNVFAQKRTTFKNFEPGIKRPFNSLRIPLITPWLYPDALRYDDIRGSNLAYWRKDAIASNGYNEDIAGWGREDTEFVARLTFRGIKRRKLKFAAKQYHIYHPEASRDQLDDNDAILTNTIDNKLIRCENGLDKYL
jgi:glycosyltransferase involved in cell wall biosynthesis